MMDGFQRINKFFNKHTPLHFWILVGVLYWSHSSLQKDIQSIKTNDLKHITSQVNTNTQDIKQLRTEMHSGFEKVYSILLNQKK